MVIKVLRDAGEISREAYEDVKLRARSQQVQLLQAFYRYGPMISAEAARSGDLDPDIEHWVRCGEMRKKKWIQWVRDEEGNIIKRMGPKGSNCGIMEITELGRALVEGR